MRHLFLTAGSISAVVCGVLSGSVFSQTPTTQPSSASEKNTTKYGVVERSEGVSPGYILISPLSAQKTFLINNDGKIVHERFYYNNAN